MTAGVEIECAWLPHSPHARLDRKLISFLAIAEMAAGHKIFPGGSTTARARHHVIKRQLARGQDFATVLASIEIAQQNILTGQRPALMRDSPVLQ